MHKVEFSERLSGMLGMLYLFRFFMTCFSKHKQMCKCLRVKLYMVTPAKLYNQHGRGQTCLFYYELLTPISRRPGRADP